MRVALSIIVEDFRRPGNWRVMAAWVGIISICAALIAGAAEISESRDRQALRDAETSAKNIALLTRASFVRTADLIDEILMKFIEGYGPGSSELAAYEKIKQINLPRSVVQLAVIDAQGFVKASNLSYPVAKVDLSDREHFKVFADGQERGLFISKPVIGRVSNKATLQFARPIKDGEGKFAGVVVASYDLDDFNSFYESVNPDESGSIVVVGLDGAVRVHSHGMPYLSRSLSGSAEFQRAKGDVEGPKRWVTYLDHKERVGYFTTSSSYPLMFVVSQNVDAVLKRGTAFRQAIWAAAISLSALLACMSLFVHYSLVLREAQRTRDEKDRTLEREAQLLGHIRQVPGLIFALADETGKTLSAGDISEESHGAVHAAAATPGDHAEIYDERLDLLKTTIAGLPANENLRRSIDRFQKAGLDWEIAWTIIRLPLAPGPTDGAAAFLIFGDDNSAARRKESALQQLSKLATLGEVATGLAHELNQPLNVIRLAAENALALSDQPERTSYVSDKLRKIVTQTERAGRVIDHMRMFGRRTDDTLVAHDPWLSIDGALNIVGEQLRLAGIRVVVHVVPNACVVKCNQDLLEQVILNVLANARDAIEAKARKEGADWERRIEIALEPSAVTPLGEAASRLTITDTGGGIPEDALPRIFEPFFTTKPVGKGTGLGLSLSYGIIREQGGMMTAANVAGGARFDIYVPVVSGTSSIAARAAAAEPEAASAAAD
jgi:C4-dicarboxylate-specific signal transduction histidine kinase